MVLVLIIAGAATEQIISWYTALAIGYVIGNLTWVCTFLFDIYWCTYVGHQSTPTRWYYLTQIGLSCFFLWPLGLMLEATLYIHPTLHKKAYRN